MKNHYKTRKKHENPHNHHCHHDHHEEIKFKNLTKNIFLTTNVITKKLEEKKVGEKKEKMLPPDKNVF